MKSQETIAIVGDGRVGRALAASLRSAGARVSGPHGRGFTGNGDAPHAVLLCVPDSEIAVAATAVLPGPLVGHCSGATDLRVLAPHEAFGLHPLMTVTRAGARFAGAGAAVAGTTARALDLATRLAQRLGMRPFALAETDRAAYHAGASMASNFLVTLEEAAQHVCGIERALLLPLVQASVDNWAAEGAASLTGPIARGDEATVTRHREAIAQRAPELLELYDVLAGATRAVAA
jgi:predicted short-subunit dehydrogenase-like oxidoreductase (DUF2520 family)